MSTALFIAAALMAQTPATLTVPAPVVEPGDVGYREIMAGRPQAAIVRLEGGALVRQGDPLALINLGTAYKMVGRTNDAARLYRDAASSDDRYDVQLADGRWLDSRRAATLALKHLASGEMFALR